MNDYVDEGTPADKHLRKIAIHVSAYITHIRTQLKQTIPKAIVHTLVRAVSNLDPTSCILLPASSASATMTSMLVWQLFVDQQVACQ